MPRCTKCNNHFFSFKTQEVVLCPRCRFGKTPAHKYQNIKGIIGFCGLQDFWLDLTNHERALLIKYAQSNMGATSEDSPIVGSQIYLQGPEKLIYISTCIAWAVRFHDFDFAETLIKYGDYYFNETNNYFLQHQYLHQAAECYKRQISTNIAACRPCIRYCFKDIDLYPKYCNTLTDNGRLSPRMPTVDYALYALVKLHQYDKAAELCELAALHGMENSLGIPFSARLDYIKKQAEYYRIMTPYLHVLEQYETHKKEINILYSQCDKSYEASDPQTQHLIVLLLQDIEAAVDLKKAVTLEQSISKKLQYKTRYRNISLISHSSFKRLAIIYEKQRRYDEAIQICQRSIELGYVDDGTAGQMPDRIARLIRKKNSSNKRINPTKDIVVESDDFK